MRKIKGKARGNKIGNNSYKDYLNIIHIYITRSTTKTVTMSASYTKNGGRTIGQESVQG